MANQHIELVKGYREGADVSDAELNANAEAARVAFTDTHGAAEDVQQAADMAARASRSIAMAAAYAADADRQAAAYAADADHWVEKYEELTNANKSK